MPDIAISHDIAASNLVTLQSHAECVTPKSIMDDLAAVLHELDSIRVSDTRITEKLIAIVNGVGREAPDFIRITTDTYCPVNCQPALGPASGQPTASVIDIGFGKDNARIAQVGSKIRIAQPRTHRDGTEFYALFDAKEIIAKTLSNYPSKEWRIEHIKPAAVIMTDMRLKFLNAN